VIALFLVLVQDGLGPEKLDWPVPEFTLTDQLGKTVTLEDLRGKIWIADFFFTICRGPCSSMTHQMKELQNDLPSDIVLVSISVDPNRDTPAVLKDYADQMKADHSRWRFLTGDKELIFKLAIQGFKSPTEDPPKNSDQVTHSQFFFLVGPNGKIHRYYKYNWEEPKHSAELMKQIRVDALKLWERRKAFMMLPTVNAVLNGTSAILLLAGFFLIKSRKIGAHKACMLAALTVSALFLASYLVYHFEVGSVKYQGPVRELYLGILLTHTVLAVVIVPLIFITVVRGFRGQFEKHRKIAKVTFPLWLYVSVTGVVIYLMLYA